LKAIAHLNPLTYEVDALRALTLVQAASDYGIWLDLGVLVGIRAALTAIADKRCARVGFSRSIDLARRAAWRGGTKDAGTANSSARPRARRFSRLEAGQGSDRR